MIIPRAPLGPDRCVHTMEDEKEEKITKLDVPWCSRANESHVKMD
jgi:hypothetical protein